MTTDVHQQVTDAIIAAIEAGAGDWQMPWHQAGAGLNRPVNVDTSKAYRGINVLSLWASAQARGFATGTWGTYRQWQEKGCQVRKGEKGSMIVFYREIAFQSREDETGKAEDVRRLMAKASWVFNAEQVDGYEAPAVVEPQNPAQVIGAAERFVAATGAAIRHGGASAFYSRANDFIQMPERARFVGSPTSTATESYYSTLFHELTHWTGGARRCDRQFGKRFGDGAYAAEELVAELGAAFICADLGVTLTPRPDHAAYVQDWLKVLKSDKKAIFTAASAANKAVDFLSGLQSCGDDAADYQIAA